MIALIRHVRFTFRLLAKNPGFTAVAVLALALGIGPNTAIFSVVYANLLAPMPYPHSDQLVMVWSKAKGDRNQVSAADFLDWKRQASSFQQMAAFIGQDYNLFSTQEPQYIDGQRVSTNWYKLLGERVWMELRDAVQRRS
jgi:putative ABC transport system permease protein